MTGAIRPEKPDSIVDGLGVSMSATRIPKPLPTRWVAVPPHAPTTSTYLWKPIVSGAGHDSQVLARTFPRVMIFVPSVEGRSHSPEECTPIEQMLPGVGLLAEACRRLAY